MSFLVGAALAIGLLVVLPLAAHFLRRGRAKDQPFAAAALVKAAQTATRRERRLEDRALFSLRALAIVALALLGATPFVRCSRLSLGRGGGGALAVAIVLDDSLSMRAVPKGRSRFELGRDAALRLLDAARPGDSVALVLAGAPARVALAASTDLALARRTVQELAPSDRSTDLAAALALARGSFGGADAKRRRLFVLSDFAAPRLPEGDPPLVAPLPELAARLPDCGVASAERHGTNVAVVVACNTVEAARGRAVELASDASKRAPLEARAGVQTLTLELGGNAKGDRVRLTGKDALGDDDDAVIAADSLAVRVSVLADQTDSGAVTGGPPLVEQVIAALDREIALRPLSVVPDQPAELERDALLVLDDPAGLGPEARSALVSFAEHGGTAVALLGPRTENGRLGATLEPFAVGAVRFERNPKARGADVASLGWLGAEAASLGELAPRGRAWIDPGHAPGTNVTAKWSDGAPFIVERDLGRGLIVTVTLPSSIAVSDFGLRPGFVALIDHLIESARQRRGLTHSVAGTTWAFGAERPRIVGPGGPLPLEDNPERGRVAIPTLHGAYHLSLDGREETRTVTLDPQEITADPQPPPKNTAVAASGAERELTDVSVEAGFLLAALLGLELALRALRVDARARFR
ncbi:MAG TPA: VWA domain-containing protein [Polyangiaceae bacterium]|nr:VWA domain-containing protein [Polyangiaceae bacterium]